MSQNDEKLTLTIGERLKQARKSAEKTQQDIIELLGYGTIPTISKWENDRVDKISSKVFKVYSDISGFTIDYLQGFVDNPKQTRAENTNKRLGERIELTLNYLNFVSKYRFNITDEDKIEVLEYDSDNDELKRILPQESIIMNRHDIMALFDIVSRSAAGIVESYLEYEVIPKKIGREAFIDVPAFIKRYSTKM